jgi:chemotaxis protein histidine kinase CheA
MEQREMEKAEAQLLEMAQTDTRVQNLFDSLRSEAVELSETESRANAKTKKDPKKAAAKAPPKLTKTMKKMIEAKEAKSIEADTDTKKMLKPKTTKAKKATAPKKEKTELSNHEREGRALLEKLALLNELLCPKDPPKKETTVLGNDYQDDRALLEELVGGEYPLEDLLKCKESEESVNPKEMTPKAGTIEKEETRVSKVADAIADIKAVVATVGKTFPKTKTAAVAKEKKETKKPKVAKDASLSDAIADMQTAVATVIKEEKAPKTKTAAAAVTKEKKEKAPKAEKAPKVVKAPKKATTKTKITKIASATAAAAEVPASSSSWSPHTMVNPPKLAAEVLTEATPEAAVESSDDAVDVSGTF